MIFVWPACVHRELAGQKPAAGNDMVEDDDKYHLHEADESLSPHA